MAAADDGMTLAHLQRQVALWAQQNWEDRTDYENRDLPFYRLVVVTGRMSSAVAAMADGVIFDPEEDARVDPDVCREDLQRQLGELIVLAAELAARNGWSLDEIVRRAWKEVRGADWRPYPNVGRPPKEDG